MYYINIFFIYSIIGFLYEIALAVITSHQLESGFLYGFWTPIYGIGVILILLISRWLFKKIKGHKIVKEIIFFMVITIILTIIEGSAGYLIRLIFHKDYWNYSKLAFNIGKYMALEISLIWGVFSLLLLKYIHPLVKKITTKIPKATTITWIILFLIDLGLTFIFKTS